MISQHRGTRTCTHPQALGAAPTMGWREAEGWDSKHCATTYDIYNALQCICTTHREGWMKLETFARCSAVSSGCKPFALCSILCKYHGQNTPKQRYYTGNQPTQATQRHGDRACQYSGLCRCHFLSLRNHWVEAHTCPLQTCLV